MTVMPALAVAISFLTAAINPTQTAWGPLTWGQSQQEAIKKLKKPPYNASSVNCTKGSLFGEEEKLATYCSAMTNYTIDSRHIVVTAIFAHGELVKVELLFVPLVSETPDECYAAIQTLLERKYGRPWVKTDQVTVWDTANIILSFMSIEEDRAPRLIYSSAKLDELVKAATSSETEKL